nr:MAG TPA: hypothetical protein [Caudoviricetes sp.]
MYRLLGLLFSVKVKKRKSGCMLIAVVLITNERRKTDRLLYGR